MPDIRRLPLPWLGTGSNNNTNGIFVPHTPWLRASEVGEVRATYEVQSITHASMTFQPAYQTANVENTPSPANGTTFGSVSSGNGYVYPTSFTNISANTLGKQLVRFGWLVKSNSDGTLQTGAVAGVIEIVKCA